MNYTERERRAMRANGTAFAILYEPRPTPNSVKPPGKRGPKPKLKLNTKVLQDLENTAPAFNTPLPTRASQDRSNAIKRRSPSTC